MNREQAERILDAYLSTCYAVDADGMYPDTDSKKGRDSLREVILDAMTEYDKVIAAMNKAAGNWAKVDEVLLKVDIKPGTELKEGQTLRVDDDGNVTLEWLRGGAE